MRTARRTCPAGHRVGRPVRLALAVGVLAGLLAVGLPATPAAATYKRGIDISQYQNTVNWTQVGNANVKFVIARATSGDTYADPEYANNRAGAAAENIPFGAYHYAKPNGTTQDAIGEANFFVNTATPAQGDLIPVLDLEQTGGLSRGRLEDWVAAWLNRVENRTGVKPMIYTSPSFWMTSMGNTTRFARRKFPLWIANWDVRRPDVPANDWSGHGWTFWQYTDCGSVPGAANDQGCVDLDRYRFDRFGRVSIH